MTFTGRDGRQYEAADTWGLTFTCPWCGKFTPEHHAACPQRREEPEDDGTAD